MNRFEQYIRKNVICTTDEGEQISGYVTGTEVNALEEGGVIVYFVDMDGFPFFLESSVIKDIAEI